MGACSCKPLTDEPKSASDMTLAASANGSEKNSKPPPLAHLASAPIQQSPAFMQSIDIVDGFLCSSDSTLRSKVLYHCSV